MKLALSVTAVTCAVLAGTAVGGHRALASDHDDGVSDVKVQNTNLTDVYVFTDKTAEGAGAGTNLCVAVNCNPRSLPQQQYYFNTSARYKIHFAKVGVGDGTTAHNTPTRTATDDLAPKTTDDFVLTYTFGAPNATTHAQPMTIAATRGGVALTGATTDNASPANPLATTPVLATPTTAAGGGIYTVALDSAAAGSTATVFAGTRQDPFFFDVEKFFTVRSTAVQRAAHAANNALPNPGQAVFANDGTQQDFTKGYNVLSIVTKLPIAQIAGDAVTNVFDVWATVDVLS